MILEGRVDGAAINSTVLEWVLSEHHDLNKRIRVIETIGPSPIPPWVISRRVPRMARFVAASDTDYDPIRSMARAAEEVRFGDLINRFLRGRTMLNF
jgi:hypothetical protein